MTSATELIDAKITALGDWRGEMLARIRKIIRQADPDVVEDVKWRKPSNPAGVPVWEHDGLLCTGETYKSAVKLTFANGAALRVLGSFQCKPRRKCAARDRFSRGQQDQREGAESPDPRGGGIEHVEARYASGAAKRKTR